MWHDIEMAQIIFIFFLVGKKKKTSVQWEKKHENLTNDWVNEQANDCEKQRGKWKATTIKSIKSEQKKKEENKHHASDGVCPPNNNNNKNMLLEKKKSIVYNKIK